MNIKEVQALSDEALRIKVAELCGFRDIHPIDNALCDDAQIWTLVGLPHNDSPGGPWVFGDNPVPDYPNDLNAMHEAEDMLNAGQINHYESNLMRLGCARLLVATARQRCEAFVLTMEG